MSYKLYSENGLYYESSDDKEKGNSVVVELKLRAIEEETKHSAYFTISIEKIKDLIRQYFKDHVIDPNRAPDLKLDDIVKIVFESYGMDISNTLAVEVRVDYPYISQDVLDRHKTETLLGEEIKASYEKEGINANVNPNCENGVCYISPTIDINKPKTVTTSIADKYGPLFSYIRRKSVPVSDDEDIDYGQPHKRESDDE